jgi:hypothetical protein
MPSEIIRHAIRWRMEREGCGRFEIEREICRWEISKARYVSSFSCSSFLKTPSSCLPLSFELASQADFPIAITREDANNLVMRAEGVLRLMLNVSLYVGMTLIEDGKHVRSTVFEDGERRLVTFRVCPFLLLFHLSSYSPLILLSSSIQSVPLLTPSPA